MIRCVQLMANEVARNVNIPANYSYVTTKIVPYLNKRYRALYNSQFWGKTMDFYTVPLPPNVAEVTLPKRIGPVMRIVNITTDDTMYLIDAASFSDKTISIRNVFRIFLESCLEDETPVGTALGTSNVLQQPVAGILTIVSNNTADKSVQVYVRGVDANGEIVQDTIISNATNGTTPVNGVTVFASVESISKNNLTDGILTIKDSGSNTVATISQWEVSPEYQRIKFETTEVEQSQLSVCAQRAFVPFLNTMDVPVFECEDALVAGATADAWKEQEKLDMMSIEEARYAEEKKNLINQLLEKSGNATILMPSGRA